MTVTWDLFWLSTMARNTKKAKKAQISEAPLPQSSQKATKSKSKKASVPDATQTPELTRPKPKRVKLVLAASNTRVERLTSQPVGNEDHVDKPMEPEEGLQNTEAAVEALLGLGRDNTAVTGRIHTPTTSEIAEMDAASMRLQADVDRALDSPVKVRQSRLKRKTPAEDSESSDDGYGDGLADQAGEEEYEDDEDKEDDDDEEDDNDEEEGSEGELQCRDSIHRCLPTSSLAPR